MEIRKLDETYIEHTYHRHTPILMRGKGCKVYDSEGKAYVDLSAGITVNSLGFSDPAWQTAVMSQLLQLQHASNRYYTAPQVLLAEPVSYTHLDVYKRQPLLIGLPPRCIPHCSRSASSPKGSFLKGAVAAGD